MHSGAGSCRIEFASFGWVHRLINWVRARLTFQNLISEECDAKIGYVACDRCADAVHKDLLEIHKMQDQCIKLRPGTSKCPLCHEIVEKPTNGGWKNHLMVDPNGCVGTIKRRSRIWAVCLSFLFFVHRVICDSIFTSFSGTYKNINSMYDN